MTTGTFAPEEFEAPQTPAKDGQSLLGRVGGLTVRARLIVLGATLSILLAVVAIVAVTGVSNIKSAYNADQIPGTNRDVSHAAYEGWLQSDDQMNMYAAVQALHNPAYNALAAATWRQLLQGRRIENRNLTLLAHGHLTPQQWAIFHEITTNLPVYNGWTDKMYATLQHINSLSGAAQTAAIMSGVKDISVSNANVSNLMGNLYNKLSNQIGDDENVVSSRIPATVNSTLTLSIVHRHRRAAAGGRHHLPDHPLDHEAARQGRRRCRPGGRGPRRRRARRARSR